MLSHVLGYVVAAVVAWWAWTGPIHDWRTITPDERLAGNAADMARCVRGHEYTSGASGSTTVTDPETACARRLNLYRHEGQWYSQSVPRTDNGGA